jgi:hypothetical protein
VTTRGSLAGAALVARRCMLRRAGGRAPPTPLSGEDSAPPQPRTPRGILDSAHCRYGPNALTPPKKPGFFAKLWGQLNNVLIFILLAAAVVVAGLQARALATRASPLAPGRGLDCPRGSDRKAAAARAPRAPPPSARSTAPVPRPRRRRASGRHPQNPAGDLPTNAVVIHALPMNSTPPNSTPPNTRRSGSRWASSSG